MDTDGLAGATISRRLGRRTFDHPMPSPGPVTALVDRTRLNRPASECGLTATRLAYLAALVFGSTVLAREGLAQTTDPYAITAQEKAACGADARRLCEAAYPDEHALLLCMKTNRQRLGPTCLPVFEAGLRRRGL